MAEYAFRFTEDLLVTMMWRFRQQASSRFWRSPIKLLCFLGLGSLFALGVYNAVVVPSLVFGSFLLLLLAGPRIDYWLMKRRFRNSPFYNCDIRLSVTAQGVESRTEKSHTLLAWSAFTKVRRMRDGFLLLSGPQLFYWWPHTGLTSGTVEDVEALLRSTVADYAAL